MDNILRQAYGGAVNTGRTLFQATGKIGGHRNVFVKTIRGGKGELNSLTTGGILTNPFKGRAKFFAGDLLEYTPNQGPTEGATVKILKFYEVAKATATDATTILLVRDGYHHIPFVGDNIMIGQKDFTTKAKGVTITAVEKTTDGGNDVWKVTISDNFGAALKVKDVLVEAEKAAASVLPMVTNPNAYADCDYDFLYDPSTGDDDYEGARYFPHPILAQADTVIDLVAIGTLPPAVLALNKSIVKSWFYFY